MTLFECPSPVSINRVTRLASRLRSSRWTSSSQKSKASHGRFSLNLRSSYERRPGADNDLLKFFAGWLTSQT
jgi:hypothetical protein